MRKAIAILSVVRNIPHNNWSNRSTHYRHDKQRRSKLGLCTRIPQCQREDSRQHDALSQIQSEERNEGYGSATYHHNTCCDKGDQRTDQQHQPWLDIIHDNTTNLRSHNQADIGKRQRWVDSTLCIITLYQYLSKK